jgi:hypothetical protein
MAADPKTALATFSLALGMDNVSAEESVQPAGQRPRLVRSRNVRLTKVPGMVSKAPGCTQIGSSLTPHRRQRRGTAQSIPRTVTSTERVLSSSSDERRSGAGQFTKHLQSRSVLSV